MNTPLHPEELAAAEVCFAAVGALLYAEPSVETVAEAVASRQFAEAPYAADNAWACRGLEQLDQWCAEAAEAAGAQTAGGAGTPEAPEAPEALDPAATAALLAASPAFVERVDALRREWLRLFVGLGTPEASCLESFYVEPNSHMFGQNTLAVRAAYKRHGLQVERLHAEPDDHLGLMLGFVAHLIAAERAALEAGDADRAAALADEQRVFLADHILPWLAVWHYAVAKHGRTAYFRGVGDFTFGLAACYAERFNIRFDEEARVFKQRR